MTALQGTGGWGHAHFGTVAAGKSGDSERGRRRWWQWLEVGGEVKHTWTSLSSLEEHLTPPGWREVVMVGGLHKQRNHTGLAGPGQSR